MSMKIICFWSISQNLFVNATPLPCSLARNKYDFMALLMGFLLLVFGLASSGILIISETAFSALMVFSDRETPTVSSWNSINFMSERQRYRRIEIKISI